MTRHSQLTVRQVRFADAIAEGLNGTRAAERAGYSGPEHKWATVASANLKKPTIREYLDEAIANRDAALRANAAWRRAVLKKIIEDGIEPYTGPDGTPRMRDARAAAQAVDILNKMDRAYDPAPAGQLETPRLVIEVEAERVDDDANTTDAESGRVLQ